MAQKYIRSEYNGTVVLSNIRKGRASIPVFGMNETYTATKVNQWYDGSPMDDSKADGSVYLKLTETGEYFLVNLPNKGELFLEKDTMEQMRGLNSVEILLLKMGYYKGVTLNGYYDEGDTPAPIDYYISSTSAVDDGGSIISVGGIKLEHDFVGFVNPLYFGCKNKSSESSSVQWNYLQAYCVLKGYDITLAGLDLSFSQSIIINSKIKMYGSVRNTIFRFTSLPADNYAFIISQSASVNGLEMDGIRIIGSSTNNFMRLNPANNINYSVTDANVQNLRVEGFNIGLQSNYSWCNLFSNVRFNGVIEPLVLNAQTNNTLFSRCSFVSYYKSLKHTNCEGIEYSSCNFANFNLDESPSATQSFMSLLQSNVLITNPYFEYLNKGVLAVGGSNEINKSSLNILGGKTTDDYVKIRINGDDVKISLKGLNNKDGVDSYRFENVSNDIAPINYVRELYVDNSLVLDSNNIVSFDGNQLWRFANAGSGASNSVVTKNGFKTITLNGPANTGFRVTNDLVIDEYYTLIFKIAKRSGTGVLRVRHNNNYQTLKTQNVGDDYEIRYIPFKAKSTYLDLTNTVTSGEFDIHYIQIVKGHNIPKFFNKVKNPESSSKPTSIDTFEEGNVVVNPINNNNYILKSGVWEDYYMVKRAAAQDNISQPNLDVISSPDATDLATAITLLNELKTNYNTQNVPLTNANKASQNTELINQRTAGQQAT